MPKKSRKNKKYFLKNFKNKYIIAGTVVTCLAIIIAAFTVGVAMNKQSQPPTSQSPAEVTDEPKSTPTASQPAPATTQPQSKKAASPSPIVVPIKIVELVGFNSAQSYPSRDGVHTVDDYLTLGRVKFSGNAGGTVNWQVEERYNGSAGTDAPNIVKTGSFILPKGQSEYDMSNLGPIYGTPTGNYHIKMRIHFTSPNEFTSAW